MKSTNQNQAFYKSSKRGNLFVIMIFVVLIFGFGTNKVEAGFWNDLFARIKSTFTTSASVTSGDTTNYEASSSDDFVINPTSKNLVQRNATDTQVVRLEDEGVLSAAVGPERSNTEEELKNEFIQVYEVKDKDTLSDIAKLFDVSKNTIAWANDIKNGVVKPGEILIILPIDGVKHTVKKGDTLASIAKKYKADKVDIEEFNNIKDGELALGEEIVIPDGTMFFDAPAKTNVKTSVKKTLYASAGTGYYTRPIVGGIKTQGIHGHNAVDIGIPVGSPLYAAAAGTVQAAKLGGYNGGYGSMIIISHSNGTQTVYGHLSAVSVSPGQTVSKGEQIGATGNSGRSTGPHLHFEVRGASNPF
ncbi:MAG: hypothetical protein QG614_58 [Patescibacteria group bacterium]|nr:hypothetical protein [Patescibacteria group bacterium]